MDRDRSLMWLRQNRSNWIVHPDSFSHNFACALATKGTCATWTQYCQRLLPRRLSAGRLSSRKSNRRVCDENQVQALAETRTEWTYSAALRRGANAALSITCPLKETELYFQKIIEDAAKKCINVLLHTSEIRHRHKHKKKSRTSLMAYMITLYLMVY